MATTLTTTTFGTTYKDDYKDSDQYYRILYNAGKALQARELTQMQTITQEEIARFGNNIFVEGAAVKGGGLALTRFKSLKLDTSTYNIAADQEWTDLVGKTFTGTSPAIKFKVVNAFAPSARDDGNGTNPATLFIRYTDTTDGTPGSTPVEIANGATFTNSDLSLTLQAAASDASGIGTFASIDEGEFFVKGHFVFAKAQKILLDKYVSQIGMNIGFKVVEDVVTVADNDALYDNQGESPNITSPGADRYRIKLELARERDITSSDNFIFLAKISAGKISQQVTKVDGYNAIYDLMATRTKEESGNYTVNPITAKFNTISNNDSSLDLEISPGVAYVDGYRLEMPSSKIRVPKARSTQTENNQAIIVQYGNYIIGNDSGNAGLPDIHQLAQVDLRDTTNYGGSTIGSARVRAIEEDNSGDTRYYLFDIQMNSGQNFRDARSFGTGVSDYVNIVLEDGIASLKSTSNNSLLFDLPSQRPTITGVSDVSMTVQVRYTFTGTGATLTAPATNDVFTNTGDWILSSSTGAIVTGATYTLSGSPTGNQVQVSGVSSDTYELITYVAIDGANISIRQKTLEAAQSITTAWPSGAESDGSGLKWIDLGYADVYELQRLRTVDSDGEDLTDNFTFDNGQRDNFYAKSRLVAKPGVTIPAGNIYSKFRRFSHGTGDFFAVNSYNGAVTYGNIPDHTKANGETISLRDVLDFRPVQATDGTYTGAGGIINQLPQNTDVIRADVEYYLSRKDRLIVIPSAPSNSSIKFGTYMHLAGTSSINPQPPITPAISMTLYEIDLQPFTLDRNDIKLKLIKNKNYTMRDIGELEERINNAIELTTLSLLENEAASLNVLDSAGNQRTKAGFLADNFASYAFSDTSNSSYRASIDLGAKELVPNYDEHSVRLLYDADNARNAVIKRGDMLMLPYLEEAFINNDLATRDLSVNPAGFIVNVGGMRMSPSSDQWFETEYLPDVTIDTGDTRVTNRGRVTVRSRNDSRYTWYGTSNKVITDDKTVTELVNEKVVEKKIIPYMRSIKVYFKAEGLRPNTVHFPFFNGVNISDWARQETAFVNYSDTTNDYGTTLNNANGHPDGSSALTSNGEGQIIGSFVIPATDELRFRCGDVLFKLLDISISNDTFSTSSSVASFNSTGIINVSQRTFESTRHVTIAKTVVEAPSYSTSPNNGITIGPAPPTLIIADTSSLGTDIRLISGPVTGVTIDVSGVGGAGNGNDGNSGGTATGGIHNYNGGFYKDEDTRIEFNGHGMFGYEDNSYDDNNDDDNDTGSSYSGDDGYSTSF